LSLIAAPSKIGIVQAVEILAQERERFAIGEHKLRIRDSVADRVRVAVPVEKGQAGK
jgi:hypothetical protein